MIQLILAKKIGSLFLVMLLGWLMVRLKLLKTEDSRVLSMLCLYLVMPCVIISSFQVELTGDVLSGLMLSFGVAVLLHIGLIVLVELAARPLHLDAVEKCSLIYSNAGNLIIPIVTSILGPEWVIYTSGFMSVQLIPLWSHGKGMICGEKGFDLKKLVTNINMIAILVGILMFAFQIRLPGLVEDAVESVSTMVGPIAMLVLGMLIASMDLRKLLGYHRLWWITLLRLVVLPVLAMVFLKYSGLAHLAPDGNTILLISLLATATPSASTITQMAQIYGRDADYASAINVTTTLLCIVTMPLVVALYQM